MSGQADLVDSEQRPRSSVWWQALRWTLTCVFLGAVAWVLVENWDELKRAPLQWRPLLTGLAIVLMIAHLFFQALLWHILSGLAACSLACRKAVWSWHCSMLGKYVPGKMLLFVSRYLIYRRSGRSGGRIIAALSVEAALQMLCSALVALALLGASEADWVQTWRPALWTFAIILALAANPRMVLLVINTARRLVRREPIEIPLRLRHTALLGLGYAANYALLALAFWLFATSLHPVELHTAPYLGGAFLLAGLAGALSLFAPAGLGVRDGLLMLALFSLMPEGVAAAVVLASRVWTTTAELGAAAAWMGVGGGTGEDGGGGNSI
ncbi:MAG: flippase-like domain-containing protein [Deltaproteobacteria bacterium]|nr:flippase-like domain-containing protein [Deltaproteobacteria bacterium]